MTCKAAHACTSNANCGIGTCGGGTCTVRVVHSLFSETDDWDGQLTGVESGWPSFFKILRLYLAHFPGQPMEMLSIYHQDKGDLLMTHYCILGNQPKMKADPTPTFRSQVLL